MRHFMQVGGWDPLPLGLALQRQPELWDQHRFRTTYDDTPHGNTSDILLRFSPPEMTDPERVRNDFRQVFYPAWVKLPEAHDICFDLMRRFRGITLDRVLISRISPGGGVALHTDNYGEYNTSEGMRLHAVVQGLPGSVFHCGGESVQMLTGTVWWFDHKSPHSVENHSADDRIHLMIDLRTAGSCSI